MSPVVLHPAQNQALKGRDIRTMGIAHRIRAWLLRALKGRHPSTRGVSPVNERAEYISERHHPSLIGGTDVGSPERA